MGFMIGRVTPFQIFEIKLSHNFDKKRIEENWGGIFCLGRNVPYPAHGGIGRGEGAIQSFSPPLPPLPQGEGNILWWVDEKALNVV